MVNIMAMEFMERRNRSIKALERPYSVEDSRQHDQMSLDFINTIIFNDFLKPLELFGNSCTVDLVSFN